MKVFLILILGVLTFGCGEPSDARFDNGYSDGYAVGYNSTCEIRATMIAGDWEDTEYSAGYASGRTDGAIACKRDRR